MRVSHQVGVIALSLILVACLGEDDAAVPGGDVDAAVVAPDAEIVNAPDAAPLPDGEPGAPDASPPDAGPAPVSFNQDIVPILMSRCGGCHLKATGGAGGLSFGLAAELAYVAMINKPTLNLDVDCNSLKVVDAENVDPMQSSLYLKLVGDTCGVRMPKGTNPTPLPDAQLELFARWIAEGAANN